MRRRTLLTAAAAALIAGCLSDDSDANGAGDEPDENESTSDEESERESAEAAMSDEEIADAFAADLEDRGFERVDVERVDDRLELGYDATGTTEDDVAAEIERIADGYTTTIEEGLSPTHLESTAYDPDDGDVLDRFAIETEWVDAYLSGSIEWRELLSRIAATFESEEPTDEVDSDDGDADGDEEGSDEGESADSDGEGDGADSDDGADENEDAGED